MKERRAVVKGSQGDISVGGALNGSRSFVIRTWCESAPGGDPVQGWRGEVVVLPAGVRRYFKASDDLIEAVRALIGP